MTELTMSWTGDRSRLVRVRFINAFKAMAARAVLREKTITEMEHEFINRRHNPSKIKGQIGSMLMHERKRELPALLAEEKFLQSLRQPLLPFADDPAPAALAQDGEPKQG
jgi:hypothetical protein